MNHKVKKVLKELIPYVVIIVVVCLIRTFIATPVRVDGASMNPTLENNELLLLKKYSSNYKRFDIVVFNYRNDKLVKRIIGVPGDNVEYKNNNLYINGKKIKEKYTRKDTEDFKLEQIGYKKIPNNMYFVMGDNRSNSLDSRMIGLVDKKDIDGIVDFSIYPTKKIK